MSDRYKRRYHRTQRSWLGDQLAEFDWRWFLATVAILAFLFWMGFDVIPNAGMTNEANVNSGINRDGTDT